MPAARSGGGRRQAHLGLGGALAVALAITTLPVVALAQDEDYQPPHEKPGPAAERLLFNYFLVDRAPLDIDAGTMYL
jgi:hypothetical protein